MAMYTFRKELKSLVAEEFLSERKSESGKKEITYSINETGVSKLDELENIQLLYQVLIREHPEGVAFTNAFLRQMADKALFQRDKPYNEIITMQPEGSTAKRVAIVIGLTDEASSRFLGLAKEYRTAITRMMQTVVLASASAESSPGKGLVNFVLGWDPERGTYTFAGSLSPELSYNVKRLERDGLVNQGELIVQGAMTEAFGQYVESVVKFLTGFDRAKLDEGLTPTSVMTSIVIMLAQYDPRLKRLVHTHEFTRRVLKERLEKIPPEELGRIVLQSVS
jgi:DNA-binding MarR family transcriptional regulator